MLRMVSMMSIIVTHHNRDLDLYIYFFWRMNEEYETIRVMKVFIMKIKDLDTLKMTQKQNLLIDNMTYNEAMTHKRQDSTMYD